MHLTLSHLLSIYLHGPLIVLAYLLLLSAEEANMRTLAIPELVAIKGGISAGEVQFSAIRWDTNKDGNYTPDFKPDGNLRTDLLEAAIVMSYILYKHCGEITSWVVSIFGVRK